MCENHPNILQLKSFYETPTEYLFVFEKIEGGDLFEHINRQKVFTEQEASAVVKDITEALTFIHDHGATYMIGYKHLYIVFIGIAHRDLKPDNVLCVYKHKVMQMIYYVYFTIILRTSGIACQIVRLQSCQ